MRPNGVPFRCGQKYAREACPSPGSPWLRLKTVRLVKLLTLTLLLALPAAAQPQFEFTTNNGALTLSKYTGPGGAVTIPDTTNGLPVTGIGFGAFNQCFTLFSVIIGTNVTNIAPEA